MQENRNLRFNTGQKAQNTFLVLCHYILFLLYIVAVKGAQYLKSFSHECSEAGPETCVT